MLYTQLRSFHAVASHGGFTAASRALKIGQPTVTTQVKELEERFRVELFYRRGRGVALTDAGRGLYDITKRLMRAEEEARDLLEAYSGLRRGHLRLAAVGPFHATEILSAFKGRYPDVEVSVQFANSQGTLRRLLELEADVAILAQVAEDERVELVPYSRHRVAIFVHRDHPWFGRASVTMAELEGERFILREEGSATRLAFEEALRRTGIRIEPVIEIGSREAVWKAVECGLGIGAVADFEFVPSPHLHMAQISDMEIPTHYFLGFLRERRASPLISAFRQIALAMATGARRHANTQEAPRPRPRIDQAADGATTGNAAASKRALDIVQ